MKEIAHIRELLAKANQLTPFLDDVADFIKIRGNYAGGNAVTNAANSIFQLRNAIGPLLDRYEAMEADAEIGKRVRRLVDGGPFDLTDSPKSFIDNCKNFVEQAAALRGKGE